MHICLVGPEISPGGAERQICEEIRHFSRFGADVTLVTPFADKQYVDEMNIPDSIRTISYGSGSFVDSFPKRVQKIRKVIQKLSPDVVSSHYRDREVYLTRKTTSTSFIFMSQINGTPLWFTDNHRVVPHRRKDSYSDLINAVPGHREFGADLELSTLQRIRAEFGEYLRTRAVNSAEQVFVVSNVVQKEVKALYGTESTVVRPGIPDSWFRSLEQVPETSITTADHSILSISRLDERKRIGLLISAFADTKHLYDNICLIIGGKGDQEDALKQKANELGIRDSVRFEGYIPEDELLKYYKNADVFACPGYMSYGLAPLEAYAAGTKIALSSDTHAREVIGSQPAVQVVEPNENSWSKALSELLDRTGTETNTDLIPTWREFAEQKFETLH